MSWTLKSFSARTKQGKKPPDLFMHAYSNDDKTEVVGLYETRKEALDALGKCKNTCMVVNDNHRRSYIQVTAYAAFSEDGCFCYPADDAEA